MSTFFPMLLSARKKSNATNDLHGYGYHQPSVINGHLHLMNQILKCPWHFLWPSHNTKTMLLDSHTNANSIYL
jgi:hypothetical protein